MSFLKSFFDKPDKLLLIVLAFNYNINDKNKIYMKINIEFTSIVFWIIFVFGKLCLYTKLALGFMSTAATTWASWNSATL